PQTTWGWMCEKMGQGWTWCLEMMSSAGNWLCECGSGFADWCLGVWDLLVSFALLLWCFRKTCTVVLTVGTTCAVVGYLSSPTVAAAVCGLGGAALSLAAQILIPLWRLMVGNERDDA